MKFAPVAKRVLLFLMVNFLIVTTISIILAIFHVPQRIGQGYGGLMIFCFIWGMGGAFISLALSRLMAKWFMGVRVIEPRTSDPALRDLVLMVHELAQKAGLTTMPQVGVYESPDVNAFATGPTQARSLVAVSSGLLNKMQHDEIEGVLGHEIAHIANGDMVTMTLLQGVINAFVMFLARVLAFAVSQAMRSRDESRGGNYFMQFVLVMLFQFVFSLLGMLVVTKFSRFREFRADAGGARFAGRERMIHALQALRELHEPEAEQKESLAFQSLKISGKQNSFLHLFSTHPPIEERIARLQKLNV
ncbi:MAG: protease HtpX [Verrucomicrobiota bacterium]|nr:protease HtpX [Verrucomicrobiota bacterium]